MNMVSHPIKVALAGLTLAFTTFGCGGGGMATGTGGNGMPGTGGAGGSAGNTKLEKFSFFVTSIEAMMALSPDHKGFGGDLRYGETGPGAGLRGADKICAAAAEMGMAGAGTKTWHAFLSTSGDGVPVHAKDRVGTGPWFDARGLQVASNLTQLLMERPGDADPQIVRDLPNEFGIPNHMQSGCSGSSCPQNHDVLTGTDATGMLYTGGTSVADSTCSDWTSKEPSGAPWCGHSWPRGMDVGQNWMGATSVDGCAPCLGLSMGTKCVGDTGGYGGIYCFTVK